LIFKKTEANNNKVTLLLLTVPRLAVELGEQRRARSG